MQKIWKCKMWNKNKVKRFFGRFKYVIVVVLGILQIFFLGEYSMLRRIGYNMEISQLKEEIEKQEKTFLMDSIKLVNLQIHPEEVRKIAREKYFMKADDEDIFMLSDELQGVEMDEEENDETVK